MKKVKDKINNNISSAKTSAPVKKSKVKPKSKVKTEVKSNVIDNYDKLAKIKSHPELVSFNLCTKFENDRIKIVTCNVNTRNCCHLTQC